MMLPVTALQPIKAGELNVLIMSDEQILDLISVSHVPTNENIDAHSLFVVVESILKRATLTFHFVLQKAYMFFYPIIYIYSS